MGRSEGGVASPDEIELSDADTVTGSERSEGVRRARLRRRLATLGLASPPVGYLALFFLIPVLLAAAYSVGALTLLPQDAYLSLQPWRDFLFGSIYMNVFWRSVRMALVVSIASVVLA